MIMSSLKALSRLTRHSSDQDVLIPKCRTKLFQFSYCNHAKLWNTLPESTCTLTFLNQFISHFLQRYSLAFLTNYDATNFNNWKSICCKYSRSRNLFTLSQLREWTAFIVLGKRILYFFLSFKCDILSICGVFLREHLIWSLALLWLPHHRCSFL